jgi:hypothetical protein
LPRAGEAAGKCGTGSVRAAIASVSLGHDLAVGRYSLPALFAFLTVVFAVIAFAAGSHSRWVIAISAAAIGAWMATFAWAALRRMRR